MIWGTLQWMIIGHHLGAGQTRGYTDKTQT